MRRRCKIIKLRLCEKQVKGENEEILPLFSLITLFITNGIHLETSFKICGKDLFATRKCLCITSFISFTICISVHTFHVCEGQTSDKFQNVRVLKGKDEGIGLHFPQILEVSPHQNQGLKARSRRPKGRGQRLKVKDPV